jgi:hypothetical protein
MDPASLVPQGVFDTKPRILFKKKDDHLTPTRVLDIFAMVRTADGHNVGLSPSADSLDSFMTTIAAIDVASGVVANARSDQAAAAATAAARPVRAQHHGRCLVCDGSGAFCTDCIDSLSDADIHAKALAHGSLSAGCVGWMGAEHAKQGK